MTHEEDRLSVALNAALVKAAESIEAGLFPLSPAHPRLAMIVAKLQPPATGTLHGLFGSNGADPPSTRNLSAH